MISKEDRFPKRGEIWIVNYNYKFSSLLSEEKEITIESQIRKNRPCIIVSNNIYNKFSKFVLAVPLTSQSTADELGLEDPSELLISASEVGKLNKNSKVLITFINYLGKPRLKEFVGSVREEIMEEITRKLFTLVSQL